MKKGLRELAKKQKITKLSEFWNARCVGVSHHAGAPCTRLKGKLQTCQVLLFKVSRTKSYLSTWAPAECVGIMVRRGTLCQLFCNGCNLLVKCCITAAHLWVSEGATS